MAGRYRDIQRVLKAGQPENLKKLVRLCVQKIQMAPEDREVTITYRVPEPFVNKLVAGARYLQVRERIEHLFLREWTPSRKGRHS